MVFVTFHANSSDAQCDGTKFTDTSSLRSTFCKWFRPRCFLGVEVWQACFSCRSVIFHVLIGYCNFTVMSHPIRDELPRYYFSDAPRISLDIDHMVASHALKGVLQRGDRILVFWVMSWLRIRQNLEYFTSSTDVFDRDTRLDAELLMLVGAQLEWQ